MVKMDTALKVADHHHQDQVERYVDVGHTQQDKGPLLTVIPSRKTSRMKWLPDRKHC